MGKRLTAENSIPTLPQLVYEIRDLLRATVDVWPNAKEQDLWWDCMRGTLVTDSGRRTYRALYGSWWLLRGPSIRYRAGQIKGFASPSRWKGPFRFDTPLPPDAIVRLHNTRLEEDGKIKGTLLAASEQSDCMLKIASGERARRHAKNELTVRNAIHSAGISQHVPELFDQGSIPDDWYWTAMQFAPNSRPLDKPLSPFRNIKKHWRNWLIEKTLPAMRKLYEGSGTQIVCRQQWVDAMEERVNKIPGAAHLQALLKSVDDAGIEAGYDEVVEAVIHGDLFHFHVHRTTQNWWLIDWGYSLRRPIVVDLMRELILICHRELTSGACPFWAWLRGNGDIEQLPNSMLQHLNMCAEWQKSWLGRRIDAGTIRFQLLVVILENICIHFEVDGREPADDWLAQRAMRGLEII